MASVHAFNLWPTRLGIRPARPSRHRAGIISPADPQQAVEEVDCLPGAWTLVRPAPVPGGQAALAGDPLHDPVWAMAEAGVPVGFHSDSDGYLQIRGMVGRQLDIEGFAAQTRRDQGTHGRPCDPRHHGTR